MDRDCREDNPTDLFGDRSTPPLLFAVFMTLAEPQTQPERASDLENAGAARRRREMDRVRRRLLLLPDDDAVRRTGQRDRKQADGRQ